MTKKSKFAGTALPFLAIVLLATWYFHHHTVAVLDPKGPVGLQERHLIIITLLLSAIVVIPVFGLLAVFTWRYREGNTKARYSPNLDHSAVAETIWWLVPSVLILVLGVIIWTSSQQLDPYRALDSRTKPLTIQVVALDWKWLFIYPQQHIATINFVQFPRQTPVNFEITADAPMNSFWIPQLGGQIYAMPGMSAQLHLMANVNGSFRGSSANISGQGFAGMDFMARSSSSDDFNQWVASAKRSPDRLNQAVYDRLAAPSRNNPVAYYALDEAGLYSNVILKYMGPMTNMPGMGTP
jgi:cytochrome o ubiquinol oxidase subunit II